MRKGKLTARSALRLSLSIRWKNSIPSADSDSPPALQSALKDVKKIFIWVTSGHKSDSGFSAACDSAASFSSPVPHRVSKSQWRAVPHISRWWHFHGERRVEWAASDQTRHRVEKPGDVALSPGERTGVGGGGSRVCKNHLLGCLSCAGPWL